MNNLVVADAGDRPMPQIERLPVEGSLTDILFEYVTRLQIFAKVMLWSLLLFTCSGGILFVHRFISKAGMPVIAVFVSGVLVIAFLRILLVLLAYLERHSVEGRKYWRTLTIIFWLLRIRWFPPSDQPQEHREG